MADIKVLEEKVAKAQEKVEKCKATIERHKKAMEKKNLIVAKKGIVLDLEDQKKVEETQMKHRQTDLYWEIYEVKRKMEDIVGAGRKLRDAETILGNWEEKLSIEINREKFIEDNAPQVIKDFLEDWKTMSHEWHIKRYEGYQDFKKKLKEEELQARMECIKATPEYERYLDENGEVEKDWRGEYDLHNVYPRKPMEDYLKERNLNYGSIQERKMHYAGSAVIYMDGIRDEAERIAWLEKTLEQEKKAKMHDLILRISKVVGEITDATHLEINEKGNIDGFVIGTKGKAQVQTIGAGGWNIVCFHYRTLVKPIK